MAQARSLKHGYDESAPWLPRFDRQRLLTFEQPFEDGASVLACERNISL